MWSACRPRSPLRVFPPAYLTQCFSCRAIRVFLEYTEDEDTRFGLMNEDTPSNDQKPFIYTVGVLGV